MSQFSEAYEKARRDRQMTHTGPGHSAGTYRHYEPGNTTPFVEGVGYGMKRGLTGLGNLGIRAMRSSGGNFVNPLSPVEGAGPFSDSARRKDKEMYTQGGLGDQPYAGLGSFVGEAITVPGAGSGAGMATKLPGALTRTLGARAAPRAIEGAIGAAQQADPEELAAAGAGGAVLSMALGRGGDALGRLGRGVVKKSPEAEALELMLRNADAEAHIPLSLSADKSDLVSKAVGGVYKNASPFFPLAGDVLEEQRKNALRAVRLAAYREAAPDQFKVTADDLKNPDLLQKKMQTEFDRLYDSTVKSYAFNVPSDYRQQMEMLIKQADPKINKTSLSNVLDRVDEKMLLFSDGSPQIEGQNLLFFKRELGTLLKQAPAHEKAAWRAALGWADRHIADELKVGNVPQNLADLDKYEKLSPAWRAFKATVDSAKGARGGAFTPAQLARNAKPLTDERALGQLADEVLGESATRFNPSGRALAGALTMGAGIGLGSGIAPAALAAGGGLLATTKGVQRLLTGDSTLQSTMKKLKPYVPPELLAALRRGTVAENADDKEEEEKE